MEDGDILLYGHFHIPTAEKIDEKIFLNPGSILYLKKFRNSLWYFSRWLLYYKKSRRKIIKKLKL